MTLIKVQAPKPIDEGKRNVCPVCWAQPGQPCTVSKPGKAKPKKSKSGKGGKKPYRPARAKAMHPQRRLPTAERNAIAARIAPPPRPAPKPPS